ncbi:hypothetical protein V494_01917 [Pseudogymnoascus sp. VKM F-4513 (FW-928)]|nr:hypothetical protein V494_01917 [Pseudogymnoascus sp. VKM F-4513 (FW-928)]
MAIRKAKRSDLRAMAELSAAAFMDEELKGVLMHPHRKEYPEDFILHFEWRLLSYWYDPNRHFLVGVDELSGKVVALAVWERQGASSAAGSSSWGDYLNYKKIMYNVVSYSSQASSYLWPNRAADPTKASVLQDSFPFFSHHWSGSRQQNWYLAMLATHPDFQGKGIAKELVKWGIDEAEKENVCASLISSHGNEAFYAKSGFVEVGRANVGPLKENGIKGGAIMFRDI